ncbi:uncharacterized protein LOC121394663 [Xenopus laevis]|uniref:Uncharacterized protein LOC121394663 n=1 Tax=Xenopus laevis TaxID=8355 RepID=A0A8J1KZH5_XENLA|nr:uncharacterized protein LOC121394663 [Xenopus laevis]XP_041422149.1 uncharacterized protein LOC121394663 [Xenopus laevis]
MGGKTSKNLPPPLLNETCKQYVYRCSPTGGFYVDPWVDNLAGWCEHLELDNPFPRDGANDLYYMNIVYQMCVQKKEGDPKWDYTYMTPGGENWLKIAPGWYSTPSLPKNHNPRKTGVLKLFKRHNSQCSTTCDQTVNTTPPPYMAIYPNLTHKPDTMEDDEICIAVASAPIVPQAAPIAPVQAAPLVQQPMPVPAPPRMIEAAAYPLPAFPLSGLDTVDTDKIEIPLMPELEKDMGIITQAGYEIVHITPDRLKMTVRKKEPKKRGDQHPVTKQYPFLTVGEQLIMKPLSPTDLQNILANAPDPRKNPGACLVYLKRMCQGQCMHQSDIKLIIDGILGYDLESGWDWTKVPSISVPVNVNAMNAAQYPLNTPAGIDIMWQEVEQEMKRLWTDRQSMSIALGCKQKSHETASDFVKRFYKVWKEEAALSSEGNMSQLKVQTCLGNMTPQFSLTTKQLISEWPTLTSGDFQKRVIEKEAASCYENLIRTDKKVQGTYMEVVSPEYNTQNGTLSGPNSTTEMYSHNPQGFNNQYTERGGYGRGRWNRGRGRGRGRRNWVNQNNSWGSPNNSNTSPNNTRCFNCHEFGHRRNQCPCPPCPTFQNQRTVPNAPAPTFQTQAPHTQPQTSTNSTPRHTINWPGST